MFQLAKPRVLRHVKGAIGKAGEQPAILLFVGLFIQAGVVLSMLISSTVLLKVYSYNKFRNLMSPRRPALLERLDKGAQGRHESLEEEINFYKLSEVTASNTTNYYIHHH